MGDGVAAETELGLKLAEGGELVGMDGSGLTATEGESLILGSLIIALVPMRNTSCGKLVGKVVGSEGRGL